MESPKTTTFNKTTSTSQKLVSPLTMLIVSILIFIVSAIYLNNLTTSVDFDAEKQKFILWFFRVITALAASAFSISLPGMLQVNYNNEGVFIKKEGNRVATLTDVNPKIVSSGAIAVFVLVYLFNPIISL